jgi:hypothetical protein
MTTVYIKQHIRELDDDRIQGLSAATFRTLMRLRCLAGYEDRDGELPPYEQIAFRLRPDALEADFEELRKVGLLEKLGNGGWRLTTFQAEQSPVSNAERQRAWRERHGLAPKTEPEPGRNETLQPPVVVVQEQVPSTESQVQEQEQEQGGSLRNGPLRNEALQPVVVVGQLKSLGVLESMAAKLVQDYGPEHCASKIPAYLQQIKAGKTHGPGWLVRAIQEDWKDASPPDPNSDVSRQRYVEGQYADFIEH